MVGAYMRTFEVGGVNKEVESDQRDGRRMQCFSILG